MRLNMRLNIRLQTILLQKPSSIPSKNHLHLILILLFCSDQILPKPHYQLRQLRRRQRPGTPTRKC